MILFQFSESSVVAEVGMTMDGDFTEALNDPESDEYQQLAQDCVDAVSVINTCSRSEYVLH